MKKPKKIKKIKIPQNIKSYDAEVIGILPNTQFKVRIVTNQRIVECFIAGKMRYNHIRIILGDKVKVDTHKRIIFRYLKKDKDKDKESV